MPRLIAMLEISFPNLITVAFLTISTTQEATAEVPEAQAEKPFHVKYRQIDISSDSVSNDCNDWGECAHSTCTMGTMVAPPVVTGDTRKVRVS